MNFFFIIKGFRIDLDFMLLFESVIFYGEFYVDRCVELCWRMYIQDFFMILDFSSLLEIVDKIMFRFFI